MTTATADAAAGHTPGVWYGSISRGRRRTLYWSYFFLILFVIFFLTPPVYMFITSLKSSAEISAASNPWWVYNPTLLNYADLLTQKTYLIFFRNSVVVSLCVVTITILISVLAAFSLARMKFWGSATLATGVFLAYLIPDTLVFIPLFKTFAFIHD
jgi:multiple sugar transport system permease protein